MGRNKGKVPTTGGKIKDFLEETKKEQDLLDIGLKMSRQHKADRSESSDSVGPKRQKNTKILQKEQK